jgi:phage protein U
MPYGRTLAPSSMVFPTRVSADGAPFYKPGGVTLDLTTLPAASGSDVTLADGSVVKANNQFLRYGQILTRINTGTSQTFTGTATSGNFTITLIRPDTGQAVTTANIAFNASAATVLAAIQAVMGPNQVASSSGGPLGGGGVVTVVFNTFAPLATVNAGTLAGGSVTPAVTVVGASSGKFGPYDPAAGDGRQTLARGDCFILDETYLVTPAGSQLPGANDNIGGVIEGGLIYIDRVIQSGVAAASLALGPTLANFLAAFPTVRNSAKN